MNTYSAASNFGFHRVRAGRPSGFIDLWRIPALRRPAAWIARWRRRRRAIRELQALSDHYLRDIGLHRDQIESAVKESSETGIGPA